VPARYPELGAMNNVLIGTLVGNTLVETTWLVPSMSAARQIRRGARRRTRLGEVPLRRVVLIARRGDRAHQHAVAIVKLELVRHAPEGNRDQGPCGHTYRL
jgi:hypothetical protein